MWEPNLSISNLFLGGGGTKGGRDDENGKTRPIAVGYPSESRAGQSSGGRQGKKKAAGGGLLKDPFFGSFSSSWKREGWFNKVQNVGRSGKTPGTWWVGGGPLRC